MLSSEVRFEGSVDTVYQRIALEIATMILIIDVPAYHFKAFVADFVLLLIDTLLY